MVPVTESIAPLLSQFGAPLGFPPNLFSLLPLLLHLPNLYQIYWFLIFSQQIRFK